MRWRVILIYIFLRFVQNLLIITRAKWSYRLWDPFVYADGQRVQRIHRQPDMALSAFDASQEYIF